MKAIVGIDARRKYQPAITLLSRLGFSKPTTTLVHVANPSLHYPLSEALDAHSQAEYAKSTHNIGLSALDAARELATNLNLQPKLKMIFGKPATMLILEAESEAADLVAVCATLDSETSSSYLGSISRALTVSCKSSVLIAKGNLNPTGQLRAVFATDHSPFAEQCLDRFLKLNPRGIGEVTVVCAYEVNDEESDLIQKTLSIPATEVDRYVGDMVDASNEKLCLRLAKAGYPATSAATKGNANDAIRMAMQNTKSDIVIVGSQGSDYTDRAMIGSVAIHQVVAEPYPVLIIRP